MIDQHSMLASLRRWKGHDAVAPASLWGRDRKSIDALDSLSN